MNESSHKRVDDWAAPESRCPKESIRLLIDARKLEHGGIGTYIRNLVTGLLELGSVNITLLGDKQQIQRFQWAERVSVLPDNTPLYSLDEMVRLPKRIDFSAYDLFHTPHFTLPYRIPIPTVVTVHDCIHIQFPEKRYYPYIAKRLIRSALKRATKVIAVSGATRSDLIGLAPAEAGKISVVPNSIDPELLAEKVPADYLSSRFRLQGNYLLAVVSMLKPHKGVEDLIAAFNSLKAAGLDKLLLHGDRDGRSFSDLKLVLAGRGTEEFAEKNNLLQAAGDARGVMVLGTVSKRELSALYQGALALVVPSLAEGFCLPVLEAKAFGVPVVARPVPAVRELLGADDVECRDFSKTALESGMLQMLERLGRSHVSQNSSEILRTYNNVEVASKVLASYHEAISRWRR